jgi:hypothetical protein
MFALAISVVAPFNSSGATTYVAELPLPSLISSASY